MSNIQDDLDQMLQAPDQTSASPAQNEGQGDDLTQSQPSPEENEFNSLSGSAKDRFKKLYQRVREAEGKLQTQQSYVPPPPPPGRFQRNPEVDDAVRKLSEVGIATDEKVDQKLANSLNQIRWEYEQKRLESRYDGSRIVNGIAEPQYVQDEVEDFIRTHPQYSQTPAEVVFKHIMFPDEFMSLEMAKRGTKVGKTSTLKPTGVSREATDGPDKLESLMDRINPAKYPDALQYYDEHHDEIEQAVKQLTPQG